MISRLNVLANTGGMHLTWDAAGPEILHFDILRHFLLPGIFARTFRTPARPSLAGATEAYSLVDDLGDLSDVQRNALMHASESFRLQAWTSVSCNPSVKIVYSIVEANVTGEFSPPVVVFHEFQSPPRPSSRT